MRKYELQTFICPNIYIESSTSEKFPETTPTKLFYIHIFITLHAISCQIHKPKQCYLLSIFQQHLPSFNIVVSSNINSYEFTTTKERGLHIILSDGNYKFDVEVKRCGLVSFLKVVIDYGYFGC